MTSGNVVEAVVTAMSARKKNGDRLTRIQYKEIDLQSGWEGCDIRHELTTKAFSNLSPTTKAH